jgi:tripartite-type tricarboxylate transporter receptor subunit TctC
MKPWVLKGNIKRKEGIQMRGRMSFIGRCLVLAFVGIFCLVISFEEIMAQEKFPERAIKAIVGFTPGGTTDLNARMLAGLASEYLGQPVVIVNKPGATGTIGAAEVAASKPDGYTLGFFPVLVVDLAPLNVDVKYDPINSFEPVVGTYSVDYGFCVRQDAPWKTFRELIEWAQKNPGELSVSDTGKGSPQFGAFSYIAKKEKIEWKHVPYPGGLPAATALLGGHVKAHFGSGSHLPFQYAGQFRMLAAYSPKRQEKYPDVPTIKELGYDVPDCNIHLFLAPKGVPGPVMKTLEDAFEKAVKHEAYAKFTKQLYLEPTFKNSEEMKSLIKSEYKGWEDIYEKVGLKRK